MPQRGWRDEKPGNAAASHNALTNGTKRRQKRTKHNLLGERQGVCWRGNRHVAALGAAAWSGCMGKIKDNDCRGVKKAGNTFANRHRMKEHGG